MFKTFALACLAAVASATETEHHNTGYYNVPGQYRGPGPLAGFVEEPKNFYDKRVDAPTVYRGGMRGRAGHKAYSKATGGRHGHQLYNYGSNQHGRFGQQFKSTYNPGGPRYGGAIADPGNKGAVPQNFQNPHHHRAGFHPGTHPGHDQRSYSSHSSHSGHGHRSHGYGHGGQIINGQHPHRVYNFGNNKHGRIEQQFKSTSNPGGPHYGGAIADPGNKNAQPQNKHMPHHHLAGHVDRNGHHYQGGRSYSAGYRVTPKVAGVQGHAPHAHGKYGQKIPAVAGEQYNEHGHVENWNHVKHPYHAPKRVDMHLPYNSYRTPEKW